MSDLRCELCGAAPAADVTGREKRIGWLKLRRAETPPSDRARRAALADEILDALAEPPRLRCRSCATCGVCFLQRADGLVLPCEICDGLVCIDCSIPALRLDEYGRIVESSNDGSVICARCSPPSSGRSARVGAPPVAPTVLVPA